VSEREIACRLETWRACRASSVVSRLTALAARHARHISTPRAMFVPARLFVSLDYPWAERETARSLATFERGKRYSGGKVVHVHREWKQAVNFNNVRLPLRQPAYREKTYTTLKTSDIQFTKFGWTLLLRLKYEGFPSDMVKEFGVQRLPSE